LIGRAKCTPLEPDELSSAWSALDERLEGFPHIGRRFLTDEERASILATDIARATPEERFRYWFPLPYQRVLERILQEIAALTDGALRAYFLCAFSNILRRSSIWLSGSTKPQKDLSKVLADPLDEFRKQVHDMNRRNALFWGDLLASGQDPRSMTHRCQLILDDARHLSLGDDALDLLVSSPPYATCYEYSELHQLTELWLTRYGILPAGADAAAFIGTKGVTGRGEVAQSGESASTGSAAADAVLTQLWALAASAPTAQAPYIAREARQLTNYFRDMEVAIAECARVVAPGRYMILIVGDSRRRGLTIPTSQAVCQLASRCGLALERRIVREIPGRVLTSTRNSTTGRFSPTASSDGEAYPENLALCIPALPRSW
jgi:hypothetical protein